MLQAITVETIDRIIDLARTALDAQGELLNKLNTVEIEEPAAPYGDRTPSPLDSMELLEAAGDEGPLADLKQAVADLSRAEREELRAVMLVGRGDYAAGDWDEAMAQAQASEDVGAVEDITEKIRLPSYLSKGLYELKLR